MEANSRENIFENHVVKQMFFSKAFSNEEKMSFIHNFMMRLASNSERFL